jgi:glycolate oxidase
VCCVAAADGRAAIPYPSLVASPHALLDELSAALPDMRLLSGPADTAPFQRDETRFVEPGEPLAVAFPRSTAEVSRLVSLCARHGVPLVPRGAGTGLSGGAVAVQGAVSVVLTGMADILEIDPDELLVVCQPGVINADLGAAVAVEGLFYPPDPASYETCTIGGNLAENAGGLRCLKYGITRDYVLGLEVVLADGAVIRTGGRTTKDVMGYDLTHLFVGSEGTLGIITEATLRLLPQPAPRLTLLAYFDSVPAAGEAVARMIRAGLVPVTLELMDGATMRAVDAALDLGLDRDAAAMLMIESDAGGAIAATELDMAQAACREAGARSQVRSADSADADRLREARRQAHWALGRIGVARMEDVGVPRRRVPELLAAIERHALGHGLQVGVFGHAGDGNFHPTFVMDPDDPAAAARIEAMRRDLFADVLGLGGTISGEHGTGLVKRAYLAAQRGERAVAVMRGIKAALDPQGLLNPGKIFPD